MAQTEGMEERIIRTEVRVEEHGKTFEMMNTRFGSLENRMDTRIDKLENRIDTNFRWIIGIQITMWITILVAILFKS